MADATGETKEPLRVAFDRRLKLEFHGAKITSDGGLLAYRELDDALGLTTMDTSILAEGRRGPNIRHRLLGLLRQAIYGRLAGYEDVNDAERLARDPAMRAIVDREGMDRLAASSSEMGRSETEWLTSDANLAALTDLSGTWIDRVHTRRPPDGIILDMDSSDSPTYGRQEGSAYNGHFRCTCYHPLFLFNQFGDLERCLLRPGNAHTAEGWRAVLEPVIARYRERGLELYFRGDAGFAKPELYELLEAESIGYAIRLPANSVLQERIGHLLTRPVGRPPKKPQVFFASFSYQAQSWAKPRAIVARGLLTDTVIVSDDAGQFNVFSHALCWVHAERHLRRLVCVTEEQQRLVDLQRQLVWWFYADLKLYKDDPSPARRAALRARFDRVFGRVTGFAELDAVVARLRANKAELLMVLDRPEIPLHSNGAENAIRCLVTKRKISGETRSKAGKQARDTFLSLLKTCTKLAVSFWDYLGARLKIPEASAVPWLPDLVRQRAPA